MKLSALSKSSLKKAPNFVQVNYFDKFKSPELIAKIKQKYPTVRNSVALEKPQILISDNSKFKALSSDVFMSKEK